VLSYKLMRQIRKLRFYWRVLGAKASALFILAKLLRKKVIFRAKAPGIARPVFLRLATTDVTVYCQVLLERHYDFDLPGAPAVILDAGANIGMSAVFFANKYPGAIVLALEPDKQNYELLCRNVAAYAQVIPLQGALWKENKAIRLWNPAGVMDGFQTIDQELINGEGDSMVAGYTMDSLIDQYQLGRVNILKLDIEGAEKEIFDCAEPWIGRVDVIMVELHDRLKAGCRSSFAQAAKGFRIGGRRGEVEMVYRN
jgi:FkbM family methyltransferase